MHRPRELNYVFAADVSTVVLVEVSELVVYIQRTVEVFVDVERQLQDYETVF